MAPNPRELVLAEAVSHLGVREDPKGSNSGELISQWLKKVGSPDHSPWCMAFAWSMGLDALGRSAWTVKRSGRVQDVVDWAEAKGLFTKDLSTARPGDFMVLWYPSLKRYGHVAVFEHAVVDSRVRTVDGNTAPDAAPGSPADREGYGVFRKDRPLNPRMGVVRWSEE